MKNDNFILASEAARIAGLRSQSTINNWCKRVPGLGVKVMGRWRINPEILNAILKGEDLEVIRGKAQ